jgi:transposase InsO family protein
VGSIGRRAKVLAQIGIGFSSFEEAEARIGAWIEEDYNRLYVHLALGYLSPEEFAQQWAQT